MNNNFDLICQIADQGYSCLYNDDDRYELFTNEGSTGHTFGSIAAAHKWVFAARKENGNN